MITPVTLLNSLASVYRPSPSPACETCPASMWFNANDQLKCFCTPMHLIVWDETVAPIMTCDGRELALLQLQQDLETMAKHATKRTTGRRASRG
jgi:hypothetical protein